MPPDPSSRLPLLGHDSPEAVLAWRRDARGALAPISARRFLADVAHLAALLPPGGHALNLCEDRYRFAVGLAACMTRERVSLLPSTRTPEMLRQMRELAPDVFCIVERDEPGIELPQVRYPETDVAASEMPWPQAIPMIDAAQVVALVFTSGSTGLPVPHPKRWGSLAANVRAEAERLAIDVRHVVLGTAPAQHMYGLETTVLMPLLRGAAFHAGRPFYPADIRAELGALPRPRVLAITPFHLRALLGEPGPVEPADLIVCATAPLSRDLASEAEARLAAPLHEIYGCTETGQIASRRTVESEAWRLWPGVELRHVGETAMASGGHIDTPSALGDVIEPTAPGRFRLHGRGADMVNIAGKRTSLAWLNHQLGAIEGVLDGAFVVPDSAPGQAVEATVRLTALVVAPTLGPEALLRALRERIDSAFLPRPLLFVDALPRNATGKLPAQLARALIAKTAGR
jgi:acyl-coenzyme A synthetase/AMP-(fatty) acid ligase